MTLSIKIKPNSKTNHLIKDAQGNWVLKVKAPPVDGKANEEVIKVLATMLNIPKSAIELTGGQSSRFKKFRVDALDEIEVKQRLEKHCAV